MVDMLLEAHHQFNKAMKILCPVSMRVKKYACGRTKATCMVKEIGVVTTNAMATRMKEQPFSLSMDGGNDCRGSKLLPLVVRIIDKNGVVKSDVLSVHTH